MTGEWLKHDFCVKRSRRRPASRRDSGPRIAPHEGAVGIPIGKRPLGPPSPSGLSRTSSLHRSVMGSPPGPNTPSGGPLPSDGRPAHGGCGKGGCGIPCAILQGPIGCPEARSASFGLRAAFYYAKHRKPFRIEAIVILPDHLHCIWTLPPPPEDADFSRRWSLLKSHFSRAMPAGERISQSRSKRRERGLWQRRFWAHLLTGQDDFNTHFDYIHWNPVKHGRVRRGGRLAPFEFPSIRGVGRLPHGLGTFGGGRHSSDSMSRVMRFVPQRIL